MVGGFSTNHLLTHAILSNQKIKIYSDENIKSFNSNCNLHFYVDACYSKLIFSN